MFPLNEMLHIEQPHSNRPGMYVITDSVGSMFYVGSAKNIDRRKTQHLTSVKNGNNHNPNLQKLYDENDGQLFVIHYPTKDRDEAYDLEQSYLDRYFDTGRLCNVFKDARASFKDLWESEEYRGKMTKALLGNTNALGYRHTDEAKAKVSEIKKGNTIWLGKKHKEESKAKITEVKRDLSGVSVMVKDYVNDIVLIYGSIAEAAESIDVNVNTIYARLTEGFRLVAGYCFQRANVDTFQQWPKYSREEAERSREKYFNRKGFKNAG